MKNLLLATVGQAMSKGTLVATAQLSPTREVAVDMVRVHR